MLLTQVCKINKHTNTSLVNSPIYILTRVCYNKITVRGAKPNKTKKEYQTISPHELTAKVKKLKELKTFADELAAEITTIEDELKAEMTAQGVEEMTVNIFKLRYKTVTSNRFDSTAFKATHAELYNQYIKPTTCRRFSVA